MGRCLPPFPSRRPARQSVPPWEGSSRATDAYRQLEGGNHGLRPADRVLAEQVDFPITTRLSCA
ncbi:hypothetical protein GCM10010256_50190 [Streptomyces coeruleorubidus]|nr:hypothetical protein GCM10010256_50190 [Streptomyces coeruleorubidus]